MTLSPTTIAFQLKSLKLYVIADDEPFLNDSLSYTSALYQTKYQKKN